MAAPRSSPSSARPRRKSSGGMGTVFFIMGGIILAVVVTGLIVGSNSPTPAPPTDDDPHITYKSVKVKPYWERNPTPAPWHGLSVGMTRDQVLSMFGKVTATETNYSADPPYERMEFHEDPSRAGVFSGSGGSMLTVFIDVNTQKVVYFLAPGTVLRTNQ